MARLCGNISHANSEMSDIAPRLGCRVTRIGVSGRVSRVSRFAKREIDHERIGERSEGHVGKCRLVDYRPCMACVYPRYRFRLPTPSRPDIAVDWRPRREG